MSEVWMSAVWIDTDAALRAARTWVQHGEELHRSAFRLEHLLVEVALGEHTVAAQRLTAAATELWTVAALLGRMVQAVADADGTFDPSAPGDVAELLAEVVGRPAAGVAASVTATYSSAFGDRGEQGDREVRTPYDTIGSSPEERARHLLARALSDTGTTRRIRADEFGLVQIDTDRYVVVLPGVIDLSAFRPGWDPRHRSVRDLDRAAIRSSRSTGSAGNAYARAVRDALATARVPTGAELLVVGHSYGADTALDLAAYPAFNGPDGYRVTHVVAAGYHSVPQLSSVGDGTDVLVLQNHRDVPVILEAVGGAGVTEAVASSVASLAALAALDPIAAARHQARSLRHQWGTLWSAATHLVDRRDDLTDVAIGVVTADPRRVGDGAADVVTLEPGVRTPAPGRVVSVFEGGGAGLGHALEHYDRHVREVAHPAVLAFLASVDAAGYTAPGMAWAVDVSVPE